MLETDKEKVAKELSEEEQRVKRMEAEKVLKKGKRRDPNNPTREEVEAAQELENITWQDRYIRDKKVAAVVSSSKMISKVREKQKAEKIQNKPSPVSVLVEEPTRPIKKPQAPKVQALPGMIGSLEEYAHLVGTTVGKLAESRYEPPEVSDSGDESEDG